MNQLPNRRYDVLVVGGGVVGVSCAHALRERGVQVALLERRQICSGSSHGNAGWVFPSHSVPIPAPGVIGQSLRWLLDPDSPIYIRPTLALRRLRWFWRFARHCNERALRRAFRHRRELSLAGLARYRALAALPGMDFGLEQRGLILVCQTEPGLQTALGEARLLETEGGKAEHLSPTAVRERVPALTQELAGGVLFPIDAHLIPHAFVHALAAEATRQGVEIHERAEVFELEQGPRSVFAHTARGTFEAAEVVLAGGAWSPGLARGLSLALPIEAAKGYSLTFARPESFPEMPLLLSEGRVAVTLELAGVDESVNLRRVRAMERAARAFLPQLPRTELTEVWGGMRPLTPDDLPIIGRARGTRGIVIAAGHGMAGMAQGPSTGELVAQLIVGEPTSLDLAPFSPDRFR